MVVHRFVKTNVQAGQTGKVKDLRLCDLVLCSEGMGLRARSGQADAEQAVEMGGLSAMLTLYSQHGERELLKAAGRIGRGCGRLVRLRSSDSGAQNKIDEVDML